MSTKPIAEKLYLKPGEKALFLNPPEGYFNLIGNMLENIKLCEKLEDNLDFNKFS